MICVKQSECYKSECYESECNENEMRMLSEEWSLQHGVGVVFIPLAAAMVHIVLCAYQYGSLTSQLEPLP